MKKIFCFLSLSFFSLFLLCQSASAQLLNSNVSGSLQNLTEDTTKTAGMNNLSIGFIAATIIQIVLSLLAVIFLILLIMAGFKWMTAGGNEEQIKKAQSNIKSAVIGLVIVLASYAITYFIFNYLPFSSGSRMGQAV